MTDRNPARDQPVMPWLDMTAADFGQETDPVQDALFPEPDPCGTLDLFDAPTE